MFGCFRIEEIRDNDNETDLKEGGGLEISIYSAFHIRKCTLSFALIYLPNIFNKCISASSGPITFAMWWREKAKDRRTYMELDWLSCKWTAISSVFHRSLPNVSNTPGKECAHQKTRSYSSFDWPCSLSPPKLKNWR